MALFALSSGNAMGKPPGGGGGGGGMGSSGQHGYMSHPWNGSYSGAYHDWHPGYGYGYGSGYWRNGIWYSGESYVEPYVVQRPIVENPVVFSGGPIKITNPATNRAALSYSLNGMVYTIQPGFSQEFAEDRDWVIDFSRGPNLGAGRYSLHTGLYSFGAGGNGWELFSVPVETSPAGGLPTPPPPRPSATVNPLPGTPATTAPTP